MARKKLPDWVDEVLLPKLDEIISSIKALETEFEHGSDTEAVCNEIESFGKDTAREFDALRTELGGLKNDVASLRNETLSRFDTADARITGMRSEILTKFETIELRFQSLDSRLDSLEDRLSVMEKIAEFDARLATLEKDEQ